ncbi:MAG TPA: peptidylprolyl isomerase [Rudaea sp.]|nr:peptidylprolyl isomerase [Rudaea sp.]
MYSTSRIRRLRGYTFAATLLAFTSFACAQDAGGSLPPGVVAEQGGVQVTLTDIDAYAAKIPEKDRAGFFDSPKRIEDSIMTLLLRKQLAAEARKAGLENAPGVQARIEAATEDTLAQVDIEHLRATLKIPSFDELAHEYYLSHPDQFVVPGEIDVEHVLVSSKDRGADAAKAIVGKVEAEAKAHPDQFDALVEKYSDDPSKKDNHGLIADVASGKVVPAFAKAAKALKKPGDISPIVRTEYGYHVLKLVSRKPDTQRTFADVKAQLVEKLRNDWIDQQVAQHTGDMRGKPLNASPDLVASLRTRYMPPGTVTPEMAQKAANEAAAKKDADKAPAAKH